MLPCDKIFCVSPPLGRKMGTGASGARRMWGSITLPMAAEGGGSTGNPKSQWGAKAQVLKVASGQERQQRHFQVLRPPLLSTVCPALLSGPGLHRVGLFALTVTDGSSQPCYLLAPWSKHIISEEFPRVLLVRIGSRLKQMASLLSFFSLGKKKAQKAKLGSP